MLTALTTTLFVQLTEALEMPWDRCSDSVLTVIQVALDQEGVDVKQLGGSVTAMED